MRALIEESSPRIAVLALLFASLAQGCGSLRGLDKKNACATSTDCNPGHVCVAGVCAPAVDGGPPDRAEAPPDRANDPLGPEIMTDAADSVLDAPLAHDEAGDLPPPDPCAVAGTPPTQPSTAELAHDLVGRWRFCSSTGSRGNLGWLGGPSGEVQLTATSWVPLTDAGGGGPMPIPGVAPGVYYFLLEAPVHVIHFSDRVSGVNVAVTLSTAADAITLTECDGAISCSGPSTRLVALQPAGATSIDAGRGAGDASSQ